MEIWRGQKSWDEGFSRGIELKEGIVVNISPMVSPAVSAGPPGMISVTRIPS